MAALKVTTILILVVNSCINVSGETLADLGACISNPCLYEGTCTATSSGFLCTCKNGRLGIRCERKADDCPNDKMLNCNNGVCALDSEGKPRCVCSEGFTGATCVTPTDNCSQKPCMNNATCVDTPTGYECQCPDDSITGKNCQITAADLNQCISDCNGYDYDGKCWHNSTQTVTVGWGYGQFICNSLQTCFNAQNISGHEFIQVQLKPVHMQENDELEFITDGDAILYDYHFIPHILPMEAKSKEAFLQCNTSQAKPLTHEPVQSRLSVNESLLQVGTQYFIADMNALHRCVFGLRLNVTVKKHDCIDPYDLSGSFCNNQGKCFTDFTREHYHCLCCDGFIGEYCQTEDPCFARPCKNDGRCEVVEVRKGVVQHRCSCPFGYKGSTCAEFVNFCENSPCLHGGTCTPLVKGYKCNCKKGFEGDRCEINLDECHSAPCLNGATCVDGSNSYYCQCKPGYKGRLCEVNFDDCASSPCINGTCLDDINNYTCACAPGISGRNCDILMNECLSHPCVHGKCVDKDDGFMCSCGIGYTGMLCELKLNLCLHSQFCISDNSLTCYDRGDNVTCVCIDGYTGENCGVNVDDCAGKPCMNGGMCVDKLNGYTCQCLKGYSGQLCQIPPSSGALVDLGFMTDNCDKFLGVNGLDSIEQNVVILLKAACSCDMDVKAFVSGSAHVKCHDDLSGSFVATLVPNDASFAKSVVCGMQDMIMNGNTPTVDRNTYIVSIDDHKVCATSTPQPSVVPKEAKESSNTAGILVGVLLAFLCLIAILVFIIARMRNQRRVGVRKSYDKHTIAFTNAAYQLDEQSIVDNSTSFEESTIDPLDENCPKWAHEYDTARKVYERSRSRIPEGRLFDVHNPGGASSKI